MKKKMTLLTLGAALIAVPVLAAPGGDRNMGDANNDGVLTRAEAETHAKAMFVKLDVNKDGKLDKADREARRAQMREEMFKRLDTNGDGMISKAEFLADRGPEGRGPEGRPDMPPPPPEGGPDMAPPEGGPDAQAAPGKHGPRGHGPRRHGPRMGGHFGGPGSMGAPMARMGDGGRDAAVTKAEFIAAALKRFDAMDTNKDGKVTKEERQAARHEMRGQRRGPPEGPPPAPKPAS